MKKSHNRTHEIGFGVYIARVVETLQTPSPWIGPQGFEDGGFIKWSNFVAVVAE